MIEFACDNCGKRFRVPDQRAGSRGRCPQCKADMVVPEAPSGIREAGVRETFRNSAFRDLYEYLVNESDLPVVKHQIEGDNEAALEVALQLATGEDQTRRQGVSVFLYDDEDLGECLCIVSQVGEMPEREVADSILRAAHFMVATRVCISPENIILVLAEKRLRGCGRREFAALVKKVAVHADRLENAVFEWDAY